MMKSVPALSLAAILVLVGHPARSIDPEDQKLIDAASCEEIVREYRNYSAAEREAEAEIKRAKAANVAANVAGIAAFAALGFGFITWHDHSDLEEDLEEVRDIRKAIAEGAKKKGCVL